MPGSQDCATLLDEARFPRPPSASPKALSRTWRVLGSKHGNHGIQSFQVEWNPSWFESENLFQICHCRASRRNNMFSLFHQAPRIYLSSFARFHLVSSLTAIATIHRPSPSSKTAYLVKTMRLPAGSVKTLWSLFHWLMKKPNSWHWNGHDLNPWEITGVSLLQRQSFPRFPPASKL